MDNDAIIIQNSKKTGRWWKWMIGVLIVGAVLAGVWVLMWHLVPKDYDRITVKNQEELGLTNESFNEFRSHLLDLLEQEGYIVDGAEVEDVAVREGSATSFTESYGEGKVMKTTSFLVDIDSLKQTFRVKVYDYTGNLTDMPVQISCPNTAEMKYPESECKGVYGS